MRALKGFCTGSIRDGSIRAFVDASAVESLRVLEVEGFTIRRIPQIVLERFLKGSGFYRVSISTCKGFVSGPWRCLKPKPP